MKKLMIVMAGAMLAASLSMADSIQTIANPSVSSDIGARMRWGATGFEASLFDASPFNQSPQLNPAGTPVWQLNKAYGFEITFDSATGVLGLSIDFDGNDSFGAGETISRSGFSAPSLTNYTGYGFDYLSISGNEGGSTARSTLTNLVINGDAQSSITPGGTFSQTFYNLSSGQPITSLDIKGDLTFLTSGTAQERPSWNFELAGPVQPTPEPSSIILLGTTVVGMFVVRRRRKVNA